MKNGKIKRSQVKNMVFSKVINVWAVKKGSFELGVKECHSFKLSAVVIAATLITATTFIRANEPNAYEVCLNGNAIAYIVDKNKAEVISQGIIDKINSRFNSSIKSEITYNKVLASSSAINSEEELASNLLGSLNARINVFEMKIDDKTAGVIANAIEGEKIIEKVSKYYLDKCELIEKKVNGVKNRITYAPGEADFISVKPWEETAEYIIKSDTDSKKPLMTVEISGKVSEKVPVSPTTIVEWDETLEKGQSKTKEKGEDGEKLVEKQIILLNGNKSSEKVLKETVVKKPKNTVVIKGSKSTTAGTAAAMATPSRGSITSGFGMRWGRMHNGMDIAAPIGTPIYAALDGEVSFAGWEEGFGKVVKIMHNNKVQTIYAHCSTLKVKTGQKVKKGNIIANVGNTGNSTGPHLHFEVRIDGVPTNPVQYLWVK